jgi:transposase InsO family protein
MLNRKFWPEGPNQKWVGDITYIPTREGWLYLAAMLDIYSRKVVGWAMDKHMEEELVASALEMATTHRQPTEGVLTTPTGAANMLLMTIRSCSGLTACR